MDEELASVWSLINQNCTPAQRDVFNEHNGKVYLLADSVRDWVRRKSLVLDCDIPPQIEQLMDALSQVALLAE